MPLIHLAFEKGQPLVRVTIGISIPRCIAMANANLPVPPPAVLTMLIDTGASGTCIDPDAVASLGLVPSGFTQIQTPSTNGIPQTCNLYDVALYIFPPVGAPFAIEAMPVMEAKLRPQGIDGLIGRDVLSQCVLFYNSPVGGFTLAY